MIQDRWKGKLLDPKKLARLGIVGDNSLSKWVRSHPFLEEPDSLSPRAILPA